MQSKLPVRVKKKQTSLDKKKWSCILKVIKTNDSRAGDQDGSIDFDVAFRSKSTQTTGQDKIHLQLDKRPYVEIKCLLSSINNTLENILVTLRNKKAYLYNKLQDEVTAPSKKKTKSTKDKDYRLCNASAYAWPELARLYYRQPLWLQHYYMQRALDSSSTHNQFWIPPRLFSCPNINYFQPMRWLFERSSTNYPTCSNSIFTLGNGDNDKNEDPDYRKDIKELYTANICHEVS